MGDDVKVGNFGGEPYRELGEMLLELTAVVRSYNGRVPLRGLRTKLVRQGARMATRLARRRAGQAT